MRIVLLSGVAALSLCAAAMAADPTPKTEEQKTLYAVGLAVSDGLAPFNLDKSELELVKAGMTDGVLHKKPKVDVNEYRVKIQELHRTRLASAAESGKKSGKAYADKLAAQKDVTRTQSGMLFSDLKKGTGATPAETDNVKVHYKGMLIDGAVFDSSVERGEPVTFGLNQVIRCWTEGLQLMKVGGKGKLVCPSDIAYGDNGRPPKIPPGATLVFEVELLEIVKQP
jgi:FKBP-type peptidyl-prolyl cis-trans isomerase FkpA/FKBP-type peptidyl-prolyl cis-trans isomerase FklB